MRQGLFSSEGQALPSREERHARGLEFVDTNVLVYAYDRAGVEKPENPFA